MIADEQGAQQQWSRIVINREKLKSLTCSPYARERRWEKDADNICCQWTIQFPKNQRFSGVRGRGKQSAIGSQRWERASSLGKWKEGNKRNNERPAGAGRSWESDDGGIWDEAKGEIWDEAKGGIWDEAKGGIWDEANGRIRWWSQRQNRMMKPKAGSDDGAKGGIWDEANGCIGWEPSNA